MIGDIISTKKQLTIASCVYITIKQTSSLEVYDCACAVRRTPFGVADLANPCSWGNLIWLQAPHVGDENNPSRLRRSRKHAKTPADYHQQLLKSWGYYIQSECQKNPINVIPSLIDSPKRIYL